MTFGIIQKYEATLSIWTRWDESYWTSFNIFILIIGVLFAALSQVYTKLPIVLLICISGLVVTINWIFVLQRKLVHIYVAQEIGKNLETQIFQGMKLGGSFTEIYKFKKTPKDSILKEHYKKWYKRCQMKFAEKSSGFFSAFNYQNRNYLYKNF